MEKPLKNNEIQLKIQENHSSCALSKKQMNIEDFMVVQSWCMKEGWNVGKYDNTFYYQIDPKGHFLFFKEQNPIGSMSLVKHSNQFFTIGPFIVIESERGIGYGSQIWQQVITRLNNYPDANVLLYAVPQQIARYQEEGFKPCQNHLRWVINSPLFSSEKDQHQVYPVSLKSLNRIFEFDQNIFGYCRKNTLTSVLSHPQINGYYVEADNTIVGYGLIRPCIHGYRIGPLYANNADIAKLLLMKLVAIAGRENIILDIPEMNVTGQKLMLSLGAKRDISCDTMMMVKGNLSSEFEFNIEKNYGLFSLEIG